MEKQDRIKILYDKYLNGTIIDSERDQLYDFFRNASDQKLEELIADYLQKNSLPENYIPLQPDIDRIFDSIKARITDAKVIPMQKPNRWLRYAGIAAIVVAVVLMGIYMLQKYSFEKTEVLADVSPGHTSATLTLANGKKILLANAANGSIAGETNGIDISKTSDGRLVYADKRNGDGSSDDGFNILSTAKGETFQVVLPDGSHIWLNAESSIRYPSSFASQKERRIELKGEAYFEVAHNKLKPFIVSTSGQDVTVLGTKFNINSYTDEDRTVTTLSQGSVRVSIPKNKNAMLLSPGNRIINTMGELTSQPADLDVALAWKEGRIYFRNASLQHVLREVGRWYNVEIKYIGNPSREVFSGGIKRSANLSEVLRILQLSDIHFTISKQKGATTLLVSEKK